MRIALISYEYPADTPFGGIATYTCQAARLLLKRGHEVEVFAGSNKRDGEMYLDGVIVHLVREVSRYDFAVKAAYAFEKQHLYKPFDVVEAPELYAESRKILELVPDIPLVIRMHTPNLMLWKLARPRRGMREVLWDLFQQCRDLPWYLKRHHRLPDIRLVSPEISFAQYHDLIENACARQADQVIALFPGMQEFLVNVWQIPPQRVVVLANPFEPHPDLLAIPSGTCPYTISFIGRMEVRKGILDWLEAIPLIAAHYPAARFRFVGASSTLPNGKNIIAYAQSKLRGIMDRLEFTGHVPPDQMPHEYARTGIVVAPSLWENYPYACLEAMAAGRAVVGSSAGGMAVMLEGGAGILVKPRKPSQLVKAIGTLLDSPHTQKSLGERARSKVVDDHSPSIIGQRMEQIYEQAIDSRQMLGLRQ